MIVIRNLAIANQEPAPVMTLADYFDNTYVSAHQPPLFAPATWNVHNLVLQNCAKTNNICEGQNKTNKTNKTNMTNKSIHGVPRFFAPLFAK